MRNKMSGVNATPSRSPTTLTINPHLEVAWIQEATSKQKIELKNLTSAEEKGNRMPMPVSPYPTLLAYLPLASPHTGGGSLKHSSIR